MKSAALSKLSKTDNFYLEDNQPIVVRQNGRSWVLIPDLKKMTAWVLCSIPGVSSQLTTCMKVNIAVPIGADFLNSEPYNLTLSVYPIQSSTQFACQQMGSALQEMVNLMVSPSCNNGTGEYSNVQRAGIVVITDKAKQLALEIESSQNNLLEYVYSSFTTGECNERLKEMLSSSWQFMFESAEEDIQWENNIYGVLKVMAILGTCIGLGFYIYKNFLENEDEAERERQGQPVQLNEV